VSAGQRSKNKSILRDANCFSGTATGEALSSALPTESHPPPKNPFPARTFVTQAMDSTAVFVVSRIPFDMLIKADSLNWNKTGEGPNAKLSYFLRK